MTYKQVISQLSNEVQDKRAWPDDTTKLQQQLDLLYVAALSVGVDVPLHRLKLEETDLYGESVQKLPVKYNGTYTEVDGTIDENTMASPLKKFSFPETIFDDRDDLGVSTVQVNGDSFYQEEFLPLNSLKHCAENVFQQNEVRVGADARHRMFYVINGLDVVLVHAKRFVKPDPVSTGEDGSYEDAIFPFTGRELQRCLHIVSAHVNGVTIRDSAAVTFQSMLERFYGGNTNE